MKTTSTTRNYLTATVTVLTLLSAAPVTSPSASADDADAQFLSSLSYLRDTGFYVQDYDRGELIATGHLVCDLFDQGKDSPTVSGAVVGALNMWRVRNPSYNATWIVKGATAAYCPAHNAATGQI
jgi:hypothetical protein